MKQKLFSLIIIPFILSCNSDWYLQKKYGVRQITIVHEGRTRTCLIHVPRKNRSGKLPLLIVLHGGLGSAKEMLSVTEQRFNFLSDTKGFYAAYPNVLDRRWNEHLIDRIYPAGQEKIDDTNFISFLIDTLAAKYPIDTNRIFVTGISSGGGMSYRLACDLSLKIRGIAAVSASHPVTMTGKCKPARPMNVMIVNGTNDPVIPYNGGDVSLLGVKVGRVISTDDTVRFWVKANRCPDTPVTEALPDNVPDDSTKVKKITYGPCNDNVRVILYKIEGGGHAWPGRTQHLPKLFIGNTSHKMNACDLIWDFFSAIK